MKISSIKILMVLAVVLAMGAGALVGVAAARKPSPPDKRTASSWLADELRLSAPQQEQMRSIWSHATSAGDEFAERRAALEKERDDAIQALLTPAQREESKQIRDQYSQKVSEVRKEREKFISAAIEQTKQILTAEQRDQYDELLKRRAARRRNWLRDGPRGRPAETRPPDSQPVSGATHLSPRTSG